MVGLDLIWPLSHFCYYNTKRLTVSAALEILDSCHRYSVLSNLETLRNHYQPTSSPRQYLHLSYAALVPEVYRAFHETLKNYPFSMKDYLQQRDITSCSECRFVSSTKKF